MLLILIRDPVPCLPPDPEWVKNKDPDPGSGSRDENPGPYSESLETIFWVKILKFFDADADLGSGNVFDPGSSSQDEKNSYPGSGTRD